MSGFFKALPFVLRVEGGFVDDPDDRGGMTNHGVTQATYDRWRDQAGEPRRMVSKIEPAEVQAIYHQFYWIPAHCDALPWPASRNHFDAAVNHGVGAAIKMLQRALDLDDDGVFGPKTNAAANLADVDDLIEHMLWTRLRYYSEIVERSPVQRKFLRGWLNRTIELREASWR